MYLQLWLLWPLPLLTLGWFQPSQLPFLRFESSSCWVQGSLSFFLFLKFFFIFGRQCYFGFIALSHASHAHLLLAHLHHHHSKLPHRTHFATRRCHSRYHGLQVAFCILLCSLLLVFCNLMRHCCLFLQQLAGASQGDMVFCNHHQILYFSWCCWVLWAVSCLADCLRELFHCVGVVPHKRDLHLSEVFVENLLELLQHLVNHTVAGYLGQCCQHQPLHT